PAPPRPSRHWHARRRPIRCEDGCSGSRSCVLREPSMAKRLFVGNLPYRCDEAELRALFEQGGRQVQEVKIVTDRETGRPRGCGCVERAADAQAEEAVRSLTATSFGGRDLTGSEAHDRGSGGRRGGGR